MSEVKVNKISPRSGTTITLGDNGDTFTIPSGVTFDASSGGLAGTLTTAAQPNITSVGTLTSFTSTGIDDNATSTAITIDSSQFVGIGQTTPLHKLEVKDGEFAVRQTDSSAAPSIKVINDVALQAYLRGAGTTRTNPGTAQGMPQLVSLSGYDLFISTDGNNNIPFTTNRSEKMRLTSDGKLGIGTSSPSEKLDVDGNINLTDSLLIDGAIKFEAVKSSSTGQDSIYKTATNTLAFNTGGTERMRIDSSGHFGFGTTTSSNFVNFQGGSSNATGINFDNTSSPNPYGYRIAFTAASPDNNSQYFHRMQDSTTLRCLIHSDGDIVNHDNSYGGISDIKLKEQITNASSQWEDIKNLQVKKFKYKTDVANGDSDAHWRLGLIAQEVETTSPNLVKNNPDLDDNNNDLGTVTKTVKYSILYMKAVKALQEAMERIETLETKNTELEARITQLENA